MNAFWKNIFFLRILFSEKKKRILMSHFRSNRPSKVNNEVLTDTVGSNTNFVSFFALQGLSNSKTSRWKLSQSLGIASWWFRVPLLEWHPCASCIKRILSCTQLTSCLIFSSSWTRTCWVRISEDRWATLRASVTTWLSNRWRRLLAELKKLEKN